MKQSNIFKLAALALLGIIFGYLLFNWIMSAAIHSRKEVIVPDLKDKAIFDALKLVSSFNLGMKIEGEEFNQDLPPGTIIRQSPYPGITVREGKIIKVTISQGGEVIFIPELIGQPVRSARIMLRSSGLSLGEETSRYSVVMEKGRILSQDPQAGSIAERDSLVYLVVSAGIPPEDIKLMPDWTGKDIELAKQWIETMEIELEIVEEKDDNVVPGTILRQQPKPDTDLADIRKITLTVASLTGEMGFSGQRFYYEIPAGGGERKIRMTLLDASGEREIFNGIRPSGSKLELPINPQGQARVRVFINDVLVEEREIEKYEDPESVSQEPE
jgi:serine/threonine-protein kinase